MPGVTAENVVYKHIEDVRTYYMDFAKALSSGDTVSAVTSVSCSDTGVTVGSTAVVSSVTTVKDQYGSDRDLQANKAISVVLSVGTTGTTSTVTGKVTTTNGETLGLDGTLIIDGVDV